MNFLPPNAMSDFDPPGLHVPGQRQTPWSPNRASYIPSCKISKPCLLPTQCRDGMSAASSLLSFPRKRIFHAESSRHMEEDRHSSTGVSTPSWILCLSVSMEKAPTVTTGNDSVDSSPHFAGTWFHVDGSGRHGSLSQSFPFLY